MKASLPFLLLVEDNEDDVFIFRRAAAKAGLLHPLILAPTAQEARGSLTGTGRPAVTLLDLKLPGQSGIDLLF
jgi:CheY-like chemotaxis protein